MSLIDLFGLLSGIFWIFTYVCVIRQGLLDRTYAMPFLALGDEHHLGVPVHVRLSVGRRNHAGEHQRGSGSRPTSRSWRSS